MTEAWTETTVGEWCPFAYGKGLPERDRRGGPIPVFGSNGIVGWHDESAVPGAGIIIGRKGTVGSVMLSTTPFWPIDTTFYVVQADHRDLRFTAALLQSLGLDQRNSHSAVPGLSRDDAHQLPILVPPLEEQRRIAEVLGALDDRIDALERTRATTLELVTTIADVASEETSRFCRLSELGSHRPGRYLAKEDYDESGRIFVYGSNSVMGCHSTPLYPDPHVVLARIGSNCGAIRLSPAGAWVNNNASAIIPVPGVDVSLLYGVIANLDMSAYRGGTGQPFIQTSALMEAQVPDVRVWKEAGRYKDSLKSSIDVLCQIDLERLELLRSRDLLLPRLVSGELRVAAAEELVEATT